MNLTDALKNKNKLIYGTENVVKNSKKLVQVFISSNYPEEMRLELKKNIGKVEVEQLKQNSEELGTLLRKPFLISVIGIKK